MTGFRICIQWRVGRSESGTDVVCGIGDGITNIYASEVERKSKAQVDRTFRTDARVYGFS